MTNHAFYLLWLPKYFDEYYDLSEKNSENKFLSDLKEFLLHHDHIEKCKLKIYDKKIPHDIDNSHQELVSFHREENSIGYWGKIEFSIKNSKRGGQIVFNEFGFYYFEFFDTSNKKNNHQVDDREIIQSFFSRTKAKIKKNNGKERHFYPLLTESQEEVLKETFLNDHLSYEDFNRKQHTKRKIKLEQFILEAIYEADEKDVDIEGRVIQDKISKLQEYQYQIKKDEYYDFNMLERTENLKPLQNKIRNIFSSSNLGANTYKKIVLDCYEEQAISSFLNTVVSAKYFDRITKSIKEVREGLTGKIIFMTPQDTKEIDNKYQENEVFHRWSEEKIENYVQLLISKKPLFMKIDNALKSSYYVTIGNVTSLGHINEKEDISQLLYYHEWSSLLAYFTETTKSLNSILHLYHSNRTYSELEEIKHYESNNHDKEDIELLIKSNENKLGVTEDSRSYMMIATIGVAALVALPDMISSSTEFDNGITATVFYLMLVTLFAYPFRYELNKLLPILKEKLKQNQAGKTYIKSSPDDFDILEHRSNTAVKSFIENRPIPKKISIAYQEHISTHRFVRHVEKLKIVPCVWSQDSQYRLLPEIATIENLRDKDKELYDHIKDHRTTKFSVNRIDKAKIKMTMRYRVNRIKINDFLDYYANSDSYIKFYKGCCIGDTQKCHNSRCRKINSPKVIEKLKKDFEGIDAEFSFVAIYSFSLISKTLDHAHEKEFELYKDSFRVYYHIDKYPIDYYRDTFTLRDGRETPTPCKMELEPYDAISEMVYLLFLGRLKGFNSNMKKE
jgi:hypothetical protein